MRCCTETTALQMTFTYAFFDNRVEVASPGTLPAHITPENILNERFATNATIVRLINKFPILRTSADPKATPS